MSASSQRSILIVDDQNNDIVLTKLGLERAGLKLAIYSVPGGSEAIAFLNGDPPYQDRLRYPLPALVLLDIQMPRVDGFEVLHWIRHLPNFANLPVVMLTGSRTKGCYLIFCEVAGFRKRRRAVGLDSDVDWNNQLRPAFPGCHVGLITHGRNRSPRICFGFSELFLRKGRK